MMRTINKRPDLRWSWLMALIVVLAGCNAFSSDSPTATPVSIVKILATAHISATPNPEQEAATRAASSPTPLPPTPTVIPTETPYIGIFIGEAEPEQSFVYFSQPLFLQEVAVVPTANTGVCATPIDSFYVPAWRNNAIVSRRMGCPIQGGFGFFGEAQIFENGVIYHFPELSAFWAIIPPEDAFSSGHYEYMERPPDNSTTGIQAPPGLIVPDETFGDMWLAVDGLRQRLGFAQTEVLDIAMGMQRFENGTFLLDAGGEQVFALVIDGTVLGPYLAPQQSAAEPVTPTPASTVTPIPD